MRTHSALRYQCAIACLLVLAGSECARAESAKDIQKALDKELVQKVLTLRGFYRDEDLHFDPDGKLLSGGEQGFAGSDGGLEVEKVELKSDKLIVSGHLPAMALDLQTH